MLKCNLNETREAFDTKFASSYTVDFVLDFCCLERKHSLLKLFAVNLIFYKKLIRFAHSKNDDFLVAISLLDHFS